MAKSLKSALTDELLRHEVDLGLSQQAIALKYGVSDSAVAQRVKRLKISTLTQTTMQPAESQRFVRGQLNVLDEIGENIAHMRWMRAATVEFLADPVTGKANLTPRAHEIDVIYYEPDPHSETGAMIKKKEKLQTLLDRALDDGGLVFKMCESDVADTRKTIKEYTSEIRANVNAAVNLYEKMMLHKVVQTMVDTTRKIIAKVSPEQADYLRREIAKIWHMDIGQSSEFEGDKD